MRLKSDAINAGFHITLGGNYANKCEKIHLLAPRLDRKAPTAAEKNTERGKSLSVCRRRTLLTAAVRLWSLARQKKIKNRGADETRVRRGERERREGAERASKVEESAIEAGGNRGGGGGGGGGEGGN